MVVPWDNLGGVSAVVNTEAEYLQAHGHTVSYLIVTDSAERPSQTRAGFPAYYMNLRPMSAPERPLRSRIAFTLTLPRTVAALRRLTRRLEIDVVNVHFLASWAVHLAVLKRLTGVKLVTSIHGADVLFNGTRSGLPAFELAHVMNASNVVVTPSDAFQAAVRAEWPEVRHAHMETIPNGVDVAELAYDAGAGDTTASPPYVLSILQLVPYKGVDVLIRAFATVCADFPTTALKLISGGPNRDEYVALADSLGIASRVEFLGVVQRPAVANYLRGCTLFVLPSRTNSESFGIAVAEAMALDRAVVGSRIGGLPDLITHEVTGLLVTPGNVDELGAALRRLLSDSELRRKLGSNAGVRVRSNFQWEQTGARYLELLQRVCT